MRSAAVLVAALLVVDVAVVVEGGKGDPANCARYGPNKCKRNNNIKKYCTWNPDVNLPDGLCETKVPTTKAPTTDKPTRAPTSFPSSRPTSTFGFPVEDYENPCHKHGRGSRSAKKACAADPDCIWTGLKGPGFKPKPGLKFGRCINRSASPTPAPTVTAPTFSPVTRMPTTVADVCNELGKHGCKSGKFAGPQPGAPDGCKWDKTNKICVRDTASPTPEPTMASPTASPTTASPSTDSPTKQPSVYPTKQPTLEPTTSGTQAPVPATDEPTPAPTELIANVLPANMGSACFTACGSVVAGGSCPEFCGSAGQCCIQGSANKEETSSNCWNSLIGGADDYICVKDDTFAPTELDFYTGEGSKGQTTNNKIINEECTNINGDEKTKTHNMPDSYGSDVDSYLQDAAKCCRLLDNCVAFDFNTADNTMRLIKAAGMPLANKDSTFTGYVKNACGYSSTGKCANPFN